MDLVPQHPTKYDMDMLPSFEETLKAIKQLKNHKSAGPDGIPKELFKYGGIMIHIQLHHIILTIWESEISLKTSRM